MLHALHEIELASAKELRRLQSILHRRRLVAVELLADHHARPKALPIKARRNERIFFCPGLDSGANLRFSEVFISDAGKSNVVACVSGLASGLRRIPRRLSHISFDKAALLLRELTRALSGRPVLVAIDGGTRRPRAGLTCSSPPPACRLFCVHKRTSRKKIPQGVEVPPGAGWSDAAWRRYLGHLRLVPLLYMCDSGFWGSGEPSWASIYAGQTGWDTFLGVDLFLVYTPRAKKITPIG